MNASATHWDPIKGEISIDTPDVSDIRAGVVLPAPVRRFLPIGAIAALLWTMVQAIWTDAFPFVPVAVTTVMFALFFIAGELENRDGRQTKRRVELARKNGWSYTGKLMERVREFGTVRTSDGADRRTHLVKSERALAVEKQVPELTRLQVGSFVGAQFDGEFWGTSSKDGLPFWVAIGAMDMEAGVAANAALRRDARGGAGGFGVFFSLLGAYRIGRKTGVRAVIRPENLFNTGPLDRDIKTESISFNEAFHVSGTATTPQGDEPELAVLRILTPAAQVTLLDLRERYHTVGFVVEDDVLFFMAQDELVGANAHPDRIDMLLAGILAEFEAAKFSLKERVE
ncbi:hypothetical protein [Roseibium sp. M-1]